MAIVEDILKEFNSISPQEWITLFLKETKKDQIALHESILGFNYASFYTSSLALVNQTTTITQLMAKQQNGWNISREFKTDNPVEQNKKILHALEHGTSSITLVGEIESTEHLNKLLNGVLVNFIEVNFKNHANSLELCKIYKQWCDSNNHDTNLVFGTILCDPIGFSLINGNWKTNKEADLSQLHDTFCYVTDNFSQLKCISINAGVFHYGGANLIQTLSYSLSLAVEYLNYLNLMGIDIQKIPFRINFSWPVGIHFFGEIAAMRALYLCWNNLIKHLLKKDNDKFFANISAETSYFYWSEKDNLSNLLRSTTQTMAAIAGGANTINVVPFSKLNLTEADAGERLATNVQLLLREESFMDKIIDPSGGSYYIENLTQQIAEKSVDALKEIEQAGGFISQIENGSIQEKIKNNSLRLIEEYKSKKIKIVGSNIYPNTVESKDTISKKIFSEPVTNSKIKPIQLFVLSLT